MSKEHFGRTREQLKQALFTAHLDPKQPVKEHVKTLVGKGETKRDRFVAAVHVTTTAIDKILQSESEAAMYHFLYNKTQMPFEKGITPHLIGAGRENCAFLITPESGSPVVIKMHMFSIGESVSEQLAQGQRLKTMHTKITEWYKEVDGFVVPSQFFIGNLPYRDEPALGIVQPYIANCRGVFDDFTYKEVTSLLKEDRQLQNDFRAITNTTFRLLDESGETVDFAGKNNLCITKSTDGSHRFVLIDSCRTYSLTQLKKKASMRHFRTKIDHRTNQLRTMRNAIDYG